MIWTIKAKGEIYGLAKKITKYSRVWKILALVYYFLPINFSEHYIKPVGKSRNSVKIFLQIKDVLIKRMPTAAFAVDVKVFLLE